MQCFAIPANFETFPLAASFALDACVAVSTVKGTWYLKYDKHCYCFMNFKTAKGLAVSIRHADIIHPGLAQFKKAASETNTPLSTIQCWSRRYHYNFNFLEQILLMTVPHTITSIGNGRFIVSLWSHNGYIVVDCRQRTATYCALDNHEDHVLGSEQWFDTQIGDLYAMSYSLKESFARIKDPSRTVSSRIFKYKIGAPTVETVWSGQLADYLHEITISANRQYCVVCELGMYLDGKDDIIPSKVLVLDLKNGATWTLERFVVAAHAQFDPVDPNVIYFSSHNFQFQHSSVITALKKGTYSVKFRGPASVFKYRLTSEGPREMGVFTSPDFFRLTNMHVFLHRGRKVIAAMGFPDEIFLVDADNMSFIRKITVPYPRSWKHLYSQKKAMIGTISPSPDGEKLFVHTTKSFSIVDIATGQSECVRDYFYNHTCSNHMVTCSDTTW